MAQGLWVFALQAPGIDKNTQHHVTSCMMYDRLYVLVNSAWAVGACKLIQSLLKSPSAAMESFQPTESNTAMSDRGGYPMSCSGLWMCSPHRGYPMSRSGLWMCTPQRGWPMFCSGLWIWTPTHIHKTNKQKNPLIISTGTRRATRNRVGIYLNGRVLAYCR